MKKIAMYIYVFLFIFMISPTKQVEAISIDAESAIVIEYETGKVLYEKNADTMLVPASLTKIMTAYIIFEEIQAGNITLDTQIPISQNARQMSLNSAYSQAVPLTSNDTYSVDTLLKLILVPSASASCVAMAEYISGSEEAFVKRMNETAELLGMTTAYENCHGATPHYVTARSQAILTQEFIKRFPEILYYTSIGSFKFNGYNYNNTNRFVSIAPYDNVDGFKSGNILQAGYCLSSTIERDGYRLVAITLKSSTRDLCYVDSKKVIEQGFEVLKSSSVIYNDIDMHSLRSNIETFYNLGLSPYAVGTNFNPENGIYATEFNDILNSIVDLYGLEKSTPVEFVSGELLTKEKALYMVDTALPFMNKSNVTFPDTADINELYLGAISRVVNADVFPQNQENPFTPQTYITRASSATLAVNLCKYIEDNIDWVPVKPPEEIIFENPISVNIPFDFNIYNEPYSIFEPVGQYQAQNVELVDVLDGGWWKIRINDQFFWIYTQGKIAYCDDAQPIYNNMEKEIISNIIEPQVVNIIDGNSKVSQITSWTGNHWINTNETNNLFRKEINFNIPFEFTTYLTPYENSLKTGIHSPRNVQLLEIAENGFWYIRGENFEGWIDTQDNFIYVYEDTKLYNDINDEMHATTVSRQVLHVEEINGNSVKVSTWTGSKWIN